MDLGPRLAEVARRFYRARRAHRSLTLSLGPTELPKAPLDEIREAYDQVAKQVAAAAGSGDGIDAASAIEELEERLEQYESGVCNGALTVDLSQMRATFPALRRSRPDEVAALLDLLVEQNVIVEGGGAWIDYLVTLLASEEGDGGRTFARDPVGLTPALTLRSQELGSRDVGALVSELDAATRVAQQDADLGHVLAQMKGFKSRLGARMLAPDVLRALVRFNLAVGARVEALLEADARQDDEPIGSVEPPLETRRALEAALTSRLRDGAVPDGHAGALIERLDLAGLGGKDRRAFTQAEHGTTGESVRDALMLGLLIRQADLVASELSALGVVLEQLRGPWFAEVREQLSAEVHQRLAGGDYMGARPIADLLARVIPPRLGNLPEEGPRKKLDPEWECQPEETPRLPGRPVEAEDAGRGTTQRRARQETPRERLLVAAATIALILGGVLHWHAQRSATVVDLDPRVLVELSPFLESAARNGGGAGASLLGTFRDGWFGIVEPARVAEMERIERVLRREGVREAVFFDRRRRLVLHFSNGEIRFPSREARANL